MAGGLNLPQQGGFKRFFYDTKDPGTFSREVTAILEDSRNRFWVGTNNVLFTCFTGMATSWRNAPIPS